MDESKGVLMARLLVVDVQKINCQTFRRMFDCRRKREVHMDFDDRCSEVSPSLVPQCLVLTAVGTRRR